MPDLRLCVIGVGHLGKEHARILSSMPGVELIGVADVSHAQAEAVASRCDTQAFNNHRPLLNRVDAAVIAVPTAWHHAVTLDFLQSRIPVLVEKPLALDLVQAEEMVSLARRQRVLVQVGHIERFNPAFVELCHRPIQPRFVTCERFGPFTGRSTDVGAVLDMMIHDIDLLLALVASPVKQVEALGLSVLGGQEDIAHARVLFANGCLANLSVNRVSTTPQRRMQVWAPEGFAGIDFARRQLTLIQPSAEVREGRCDPRRLDAASLARLKTDLYGRHLQVLQRDCQAPADQLTQELEDFVHCVRTGQRPRVTGEDGREALALASRISESLQSHCWNGSEDGPRGPLDLPLPLGMLFHPVPEQAAA